MKTSIQPPENRPGSRHFRILAFAALLLFPSAMGVAQPVSETVLHQFRAGQNDGGSPYSGVILASDGALYGTTWSGGTNASGTVFRMSANGASFTILHHFGAAGDGSSPDAPVVQANNGLLYGTTYYGGTNSSGMVFKLNPVTADYSVIYRFTNSPDGANPYAGLIQGMDGALYGTTYGGGSNQGTVFKINLDGSGYSILHTFTNVFPTYDDGMLPYSSLVQASNGILYGTTLQGGANLLGTVFALNTNGGAYSILHHFGGGTNAGTLQTGLLLGNNGWLYGTTVGGGTKGYGTVFALNTNGSFTTLHSFTNSPDGANGYPSLALGCDGLLYGMTTWGGISNAGTIFRMETNGANYSIVHQFTGANGDGAHSYSGLIATTNGLLYGTTLQGGTNGFGTVFRLALLPNVNLTAANRGSATIALSGFSGQPCVIQASSNLINWDTVSSLSLTNGGAQWTDNSAASFNARFYRALVQ